MEYPRVARAKCAPLGALRATLGSWLLFWRQYPDKLTHGCAGGISATGQKGESLHRSNFRARSSRQGHAFLRTPRARTDFPCGDRGNPGSLLRSTAGAADRLLRKVEAASDGALAIGMASGSIAIFTKDVFTPPGRHPSGPYFRPSGSTE
jgi:hypothetical protein